MKIHWNILGLILFVKVCVLVLIFTSYQLLPFGKIYHDANFLYLPKIPITLLSAFTTWDAQHFLYISDNGYFNPSDFNNAFSPLYPFLIHVVNTLTKNGYISGFLISNFASFVGFYLFFVLVSKWFGTKTAYKSLIFLLCFPTSFFFGLIYSEALFFLFIMIFFFLLSKKQLFFASIITFFLTATRLIGVFIFVPFITWYIFELNNMSLYNQIDDIAKKFLKKEAMFLIFPLIGLGLIMLFFFRTTGNAFAQFDAQKQFVSQYSTLSLLNPLSFIKEFFKFPLALQGFTNSIFDRIFFVGFVVILIYMVKRLSVTLFVFSLVFGLLPVLSGSFMSYMRYISIIFPIYILLAKLVQEKRYSFLEFPLIFVFTLLQTFFIVMHSLNYWIA